VDAWPTLAENACGGKPGSWIRRNKVPVVAAVPLSDEAGHPRNIKLPPCPRSLLPLLLIGPRFHGIAVK